MPFIPIANQAIRSRLTVIQLAMGKHGIMIQVFFGLSLCNIVVVLMWSRGGWQEAAITLSVCACGGHASENIAFAGIRTARRKHLCQSALLKTREQLSPREERKKRRIKSRIQEKIWCMVILKLNHSINDSGFRMNGSLDGCLFQPIGVRYIHPSQ